MLYIKSTITFRIYLKIYDTSSDRIGFQKILILENHLSNLFFVNYKYLCLGPSGL